MGEKYSRQTLAIHTPFEKRDPYSSLNMPIYHTAAYEFDTAHDMEEAFTGRTQRDVYSRVSNPTVAHYEQRVKALTGAVDVIAMNSGMAAISNTLFALTAQGKNIVSTNHLFGNTFSFIAGTLVRFGVQPRLTDLTDLDKVRAQVNEKTAAIFLEIITNPQQEVADLRALAQIAHEHGVPLIADTTIIPFTEFSAKDLGVDIEIVSSTKYLSGGATSLGGLIIDYGTPYTQGFSRRMRAEILYNIGAYMTPNVAYMQTLGLETLDARYRLESQNTLELAQRLLDLPEIVGVNYVGLPDNPYHELARSQFGPTAGAMITIELESKEKCYRFIDSLQLVRRATNLFDNKSLAIHPASTIFGNIPEPVRRRMNVQENIVRISVGLESVDDLFNDIKQALAQ